MSDITANIVVETVNLGVTVEQPEITINPEVIGLNIYAGGFATAAGNNGTLQYNNGGVLGGINSVFWTGSQLSLGDTTNFTISGGSNNYVLTTDGAGNLSWEDVSIANFANTANYANFAGNVVIAAQPNITSLGTLTSLNVSGISNLGSPANVIITGGTNGYVLQTDGTGNLSWTAQTGGGGNGAPGGSNTQIQYNDSGLFGGTVGFTFNKSSGNVAIPGALTVGSSANFTGNINTSSSINITGRAVINGNITANGNIISNANVNAFGATLGNAVTANYFIGDLYGTANVATSATTAVNVSSPSQPAITSLGTLTELNVNGTTSIYEAIENVAIIGAQTGTYNFNVLDGSIQYSTANAAANIVLNFRGGAGATLNSVLGNGKSITSTYLMTTGTTPYGITGIQIDGANTTIAWAGNNTPVFQSNTTQSFTFTIIKTSTSPTYKALGSMTRYG